MWSSGSGASSVGSRFPLKQPGRRLWAQSLKPPSRVEKYQPPEPGKSRTESVKVSELMVGMSGKSVFRVRE